MWRFHITFILYNQLNKSITETVQKQDRLETISTYERINFEEKNTIKSFSTCTSCHSCYVPTQLHVRVCN